LKSKINTFQGQSKVTFKKEVGIGGISGMRFNQFKNDFFRQKYQKVIVADIFSGSGSNSPDGKSTIDGSPVQILSAFFKASQNGKKINHKFKFMFSDIREQACLMLNEIVNAKFPYKKQSLVSFMGNQLSYDPVIQIRKWDASYAVGKIGEYMEAHPDTYLYLVLDPNGPKDFPKSEVEELVRFFSKRTDVLANISATAINRCIGARNKAKMQFCGWLNEIEDFGGFVGSLAGGKRSGWIRKPLNGDPHRWTLISTFGCLAPSVAWKSEGYADLREEEGKNAVRFYTGESSVIN